jgi:hypothetical protein
VAELQDYKWLLEDSTARRWLAELADESPSALHLGKLVRRQLSTERARLLMEQVDLRRRAAAKFGTAAARMFFTRVHLEQATDIWVARYKAERYRHVGSAAAIHDYCCGIGGDSAGLAAYGDCWGYDQSAVACMMAEANVRALAAAPLNFRTACEDVSDCKPPAGGAWHADPDRRVAGSRSTAVVHYSPGVEVVDRWRRASAAGAVKLAPAADAPVAWQAEGELEWISSRRECRQLVAWFGPLARTPGRRRATVVLAAPLDGESMAASSFAGSPTEAAHAATEPQRFVYDPNPSLLAAKLLGAMANAMGLSTLGVGGAYLTGERSVEDALLRPFEVLDCLPLRTSTIAKYLAARRIGELEIKKRGVAVEAERFRRALKLRGDNAATIMLTRVAKRQIAIVAAPRGFSCVDGSGR